MPASPRRRAFGQHFLIDEKVVGRIVDATYEQVAEHHARGLLEIGPGRGAITGPLLRRFDSAPTLERFQIVEKDRRLADHWVEEANRIAKTRAHGEKTVEVVSSDFLEVSADSFLAREPLVVVSNLPYSAGTAILQELARHPGKIPAMVLMFQAEVAARLRAEPGEKAWGSLSLWIQNRWDVRKFLAVPPGAFAPPPDVNSEVVVLRGRETPRVPAPPAPAGTNAATWEKEWDARWEKLIRVPFLHRRKMLRSGLPKNSIWKDALDAAGIDGTRRAEDLDWDDWARWMAALPR